MRSAILVLVVLLCAVGIRAAEFPVPGFRDHGRGFWHADQSVIWSKGPAAVAAAAPIAIDLINNPKQGTKAYLFSVGISAIDTTTGVAVGTKVDMLGNATTNATVSIEGMYPQFTLRGPASVLGQYATLDIGPTMTNDGVNTTYQVSFGYYDHMTWTSPASVASSWQSGLGPGFPAYASVYCGIVVGAGAGGSLTTNGNRMDCMEVNPATSAGGTISEYDGVYVGNPAQSGTLTSYIGVNTGIMTIGTTNISFQSQQEAVAGVTTDVYKYNPNGGSGYTTAPSGGTTGLNKFHITGSWTQGGSSSPTYVMHGLINDQTITLTAAQQVFSPTYVMIFDQSKWTSATASTFAVGSQFNLFYNNNTIEATANNVGTITAYRNFFASPTIQANTNASAAITLSELDGLVDSPTVKSSIASAAVTLTSRTGVSIGDLAVTATGNVTVPLELGVNVVNFASSSGNYSVTTIASFRTAQNIGTGGSTAWAYLGTGTAASSFGGNLFVGNTGSVVPAATFHAQQPTAGNEIVRLETVDTTSNPICSTYQKRVTTTGTGSTTFTVATSGNGNGYVASVNAVANCNGGTACTAAAPLVEEYFARGAFRTNNAAALTNTGNETTLLAGNLTSAAAANVALSASGANIVTTVAGAASTENITWGLTVAVCRIAG